jgi:hypothetical protein
MTAMRMQAGLGAPAAAAPPRDASSALDTGAWFDAATPHGTLRLCAFTGQAVRHAVDAVLALDRCEALLVALEAWTGIALDWRWNPTPPRRPSGSHAAATWEPPAPEADAPPHELVGLLSLPWALLRACEAPDAALAASLRWSSVPAVLAVASFKLDAADATLLEPGGAVVLPDSLQSPWHGRLRGADEPAGPGALVRLDTPALPQLVRGHAAEDPSSHVLSGAAVDERIACEVRLALPHTLPADRLTGWHDGQTLADAGPRATLWRCAADDLPAQALAAGRLMPWGDGWALSIESIESV